MLAADAREEGDGKDLALAKIIAGLLGLSSDDVFRRAERERRAASRRKRRVQAAFGLLALLLVAVGVGWMNQAYLQERWRWFTSIGPYMLTEFRPHVLTAEAEQALKPKDAFRECAKDCPEMVVVPADKFLMGSPKGQGTDDERPQHEVTSAEPFTVLKVEVTTPDDQRPQHEVTFAEPFAVSKFEVTFDDWDACVAYGDCPHDSDSGWGRGRQPVIHVTWDDAKLYVAWLSRMIGKPYRLLSEAEWEFAARAGTQTAYSWGDEIGKGNSNCKGCGSQRDGGQTAPVGSFAANAFGLHDMHGNVWEWVEDCVHGDYSGAPEDGSAWTAGGDCNSRILRGGSWLDSPVSLRSANRYWMSTGFRDSYLGFRVGRPLTQ